MTIRSDSLQQYIGRPLYDEAGNSVGTIGAVFLDNRIDQPAWVTVATGWFGANESFVPVAGASARDAGLAVPVSKDKIKDAPNVEPDHGPLSTAEEEHLYRYYGLRYHEADTDPVIADLIHRDADYDDSDATGMSAGPTNRRGSDLTPETGTESEPKPRLRRWAEADRS